MKREIKGRIVQETDKDGSIRVYEVREEEQPKGRHVISANVVTPQEHLKDCLFEDKPKSLSDKFCSAKDINDCVDLSLECAKVKGWARQGDVKEALKRFIGVVRKELEGTQNEWINHKAKEEFGERLV